MTTTKERTRDPLARFRQLNASNEPIPGSIIMDRDGDIWKCMFEVSPGVWFVARPHISVLCNGTFKEGEFRRLRTEHFEVLAQRTVQLRDLP